MSLNYASLRDDELERYAHVGDGGAIAEMARRGFNARTDEVDNARSEGYDDGYDDGRRSMRSDLSAYGAPLRKAIEQASGDLANKLHGLLAAILE